MVHVPWPGSKGILLILADEDKIKKRAWKPGKIIFSVGGWGGEEGEG